MMPARALATEPDVCLPDQPTADLHPKTAALDQHLVVAPRPQPGAARRVMRWFALISAGLHAALIGGLLLWFYRGPRMVEAPDSEGAVQLVMVEQQGSGATVVPPVPAPQTTPAAPQKAAPPPPPEPDKTTDADEALPLPPPPPVPSPAPVQSAAKPSTPTPPTASPPMQQTAKAPTINLGGTNSDTNAIASGDHVVPATVDATYHNKAPIYPPESARRAQQGAVMLLIHVSPDGLTQSVDIEQSSGFELLDQSARDAVEGWHFLPAVKDGQPVPFDMELRVLFHLD